MHQESCAGLEKQALPNRQCWERNLWTPMGTTQVINCAVCNLHSPQAGTQQVSRLSIRTRLPQQPLRHCSIVAPGLAHVNVLSIRLSALKPAIQHIKHVRQASLS